MKRVILHAATFFLLILCSKSLFASILPIPLSERIQHSGQIIMAKAISAESYWNQDKTQIFTAYTMETTAYMKVTSSAHTFQFILPGGEVDGELEVVTPNIHIVIGDEYMLMVENASSNAINSQRSGAELRMSQFQPYAHVQGVMEYKDGVYVDFTEPTAMDEKIMMETVEAITGMVAVTPSGEVYEPRIIIEDLDKDGVCSTLDCDDNDPNYPKPVGAACNDGNASTINDQIQADGCTCAGNGGQPLSCNELSPIVEGNTIRIDNLLAKKERVILIGIETNGLEQIICDGNCMETQYIEGLELGNKIVGIWMFDEQNDSCYKEFVVEVIEYTCFDTDNDNICNIKDCAIGDPNLPVTPGTPCDDGNPNTLRDIILWDGCSCAGIETCSANTEGNGRPLAITLKNEAGDINPIFITGSIEASDELIIEGSGFGTSPGTIDFPNSDSGGRTRTTIEQTTDISSWTDVQIRVKIPSRVGSGNIIVKNTAGSTVGSAPIKISFALNSLYSSFRSFDSKTRQNVKFTNRNDAGGYTIQLNSTSGFAASQAVVPLEQAVNTWICASGVNWQLDKSGTTEGFANDGNCVILYEPNLPIGVLGITTSRYKASGNSSCSFHNTVWYLKEFDIQFIPRESLGSFDWNFGPWPPQISQYDFQSIALHELGHAHGLGHVIDEAEIMHYSIRNGIERRTVTTHAHDGCNAKIEVATQPNCISSHEPMTLMFPTECPEIEEEISTSVRLRLMLQGYYNLSDNNLVTNLLDNNLLPNDEPYNTGQAVSVANFPANAVDWLLIELRDENDMASVITKKPVNDDPALYDFSTSASTTMGENQQILINGQYFMSSGDFDGNGIINNLDFNLWKQAGAAVNQYSPADADGNGIINSLDFNLWRGNGSKVSVLSN